MSANLVANVTISGNLTCLSTHFASTTNVTTGFAIGGVSTYASFGARVASGGYHTAVIMQNGTVKTFGANSLGQLGLGDTMDRLTPVQVPGISGARVIACGYQFTAVVQNDGTVRMFGRNLEGQLGVNDTTQRNTPIQVLGISSATTVSCGSGHTAVLLYDGTVRTFGQNTQGQLGVNDTTNRSTPVQVTGITSATAIACGGNHTAVLLTNGTVRTFGYNAFGGLGINDTTNRSTPVQVWGISSSAVALSSGKAFTAVLLADGTIRTFGRNFYGELGVNDTTSRLTPVQVWGISSSATAVTACSYQLSILLADGSIRVCGDNTFGQLGVNDTTSRLTPVQVTGITNASGLYDGSLAYHSAVLLSDGSLRTFGRNGNGQLGTGDTASRLTPVQVASVMKNLQGSVAGGFYHTAVLMSDGTVRTFGRNVEGQLGVNDTTSRLTPVQVWGISSSATAVSCGGSFSAVLITDGTVRTFGQNAFGQLGVNDTTQRNTPVQVFGISSSATAVAGGRSFMAVLLADGTVRTFGRNNNGQLGVNDTATRQTPVQVFGISSSATAVACGNYHTAVLLADGTVRTFGRNSEGQLGVNDTTSRLTPVQVLNITSGTAVACGVFHTAVLLANGTVRTFGYNADGELGDNTTVNKLTPVQVFGISSSATAVACGSTNTAILLTDGTVRAFGFNNVGQLGVNDTTSRLTPVQVFGISSSATAIAGGFYRTIVLLQDGSIRTFGYNNNGQLGINDTTDRLTPVESITIPARTLAGSVAGGAYHTAVVLRDGTVRTFGRNANGQLGVGDTTSRLMPVQVIGFSTATAVAGGFVYTAVLLADGTVRTFGNNDSGELGVNDTTSRQTPVTVLNISTATAVACARRHTVVLLADGTVRTFGRNHNGQLGIDVAGGGTSSRLTPVQVFGISSSATAVAGGGYHTAVLLADGTVRTFGANNKGQLGVNDNATRQTPVQVWGISSSATAVACGIYHTSVLLADGTVRTFGDNTHGQLGIDVSSGTRNTPVQVFGISSSATAILISSSAYHTAVLLADGTVRTFGRNDNGQLGINVSGGTRQTPVQVFGISSSAVAITGLGFNTAVILANGTVQMFGQNNQGQLGLNDTVSRLTPVQVVAISATVSVTPAPTAFLTSAATSITLAASAGQIWTSSATGLARTLAGTIAGGQYHTAVVLVDGTVRAFGYNGRGALGVNDTTNRSTPVTVLNIATATVVAAGYFFTAVVLANGTVRTFGRNDLGALGVNDTTSRLTPVQVFGISSSATAVACGNFHTAVLLADGTVRTFGSNGQGQLGVNDTTDRLTPVQVFGISSSATAVACGGYQTAVLLADGTVRKFGSNISGELGIDVAGGGTRQTPVQVLNITSATAVACGSDHTAVLLADGTVRTFGLNTSGQLGIDVAGGTRQTPVTVLNITSATAVAAGNRHTAVLLADGTVRAFGRNNYGQLGIDVAGGTRQTPVTVLNITSATAVACGGYHTAILLANGTVRTFGYNGSGELGVNDTTNRSTPVAVFGALGAPTYPTYITAKGLSLGLPAPTYQLDLSTDKARKLSTTTWTTGSDRRIKSDIQSANLARCVDIVDSLDLKYFKWDIPGVSGPTDSHSLGWIAQDVKQFFPNSVRLTQDYGLDDFHNLDSDQLIKTMYGALKKMCEDTYGEGAL